MSSSLCVLFLQLTLCTLGRSTAGGRLHAMKAPKHSSKELCLMFSEAWEVLLCLCSMMNSRNLFNYAQQVVRIIKKSHIIDRIAKVCHAFPKHCSLCSVQLLYGKGQHKPVQHLFIYYVNQFILVCTRVGNVIVFLFMNICHSLIKNKTMIMYQVLTVFVNGPGSNVWLIYSNGLSSFHKKVGRIATCYLRSVITKIYKQIKDQIPQN